MIGIKYCYGSSEVVVWSSLEVMGRLWGCFREEGLRGSHFQAKGIHGVLHEL